MLITKSLLVCLRDPPGEMTLAATAAAWADVLGNIPVEDLQPAYQLAWALPDHKAGFPVTADEILAGWRELVQIRQRERRRAAEQGQLDELRRRQQARLEARLQVVTHEQQEVG